MFGVQRTIKAAHLEEFFQENSDRAIVIKVNVGGRKGERSKHWDAKVVDRLAKEFSDVIFAKMACERAGDLPPEFSKSIGYNGPTVFLWKRGKILGAFPVSQSLDTITGTFRTHIADLLCGGG